jgi:hypothetical protein
MLVSGSKRYGPGRVPAGSYTIEATFPGRGTLQAGTVRVVAGKTATVSCNAAFARCEAR